MTLSAQVLTKRYGDAPGYAAVCGVSLELNRGEFISIVGRSGSGKSTLMAMLGALTRPTEGTLLLDGTDVWTLPESERATFRSRHVGFIFQFPSLLSNLTAVDNAPAIDGMRHGDAKVCSRDLPLGRVSAFLLQLSPGAKMEEVKFGLAQLADAKIVEGNGVLTSSRQALSTLLIGMAAFTAFQLIALLILVSLLFSAIVQERYREVGLLRAMGAQPNQVMTIILAEAAVITALGGLAGLGFGAAVLLTFARSLGFYFALLGVPFSWPPAAVLQIGAVLAIVFSAVLGLVGAFLPAWRVRRMAPYALIQMEGR